MATRRIALLVPILLLAIGAAPPCLPAFDGTAVDGAPIHVAAEAREVVVLHFWASWCAPCRVEMPMLDRLARRHRVAVIGIALDAGKSRAAVRAATDGAAFTLVRAEDSTLPARALPAGLPETRAYGRDGTMRARYGGGRMLDEAELERLIAALVAER